MTPTQREAALRLVDWLHASGVVNSEVKETIALLRELLAEPRGEPDDEYRCGGPRCDGNCCQPVQEPVAWGVFVDDELFKPFNCKDNAVDWFQAQYNHGSRYDYLVLPLYAAPQQRTPLSDEVVAKLINDEWATPDVPSAWKFARAIERAHGITGEPT